ncbi:hypothetical protein K435DRAFT_805549 [Dendrothele bispora CBS 962.96]|uniref:Uncharacterized protein n=1 Tax=Dendrothele bispora (strain CBS 962.96) TaxID=1314807 RepID=A0A4S8LAK8_DENBC|nr:hypothetical protein K435DRAFT_805549 [Dendrothele bispora CBS 962.96]
MSAFTFTISPAVHERNIPLEELCVQNEGKRITVGIAIVTVVTKAPSYPTGSLQKPKLLLLQRAANEDAYPNMEAFEETGLVITTICTEFDGFEYTTARRGPAKQLNFLVEVRSDNDSDASGESPEPTLNAEEHQAYAWVEEGDDLEKFPMSDSISCKTVWVRYPNIEKTIKGLSIPASTIKSCNLRASSDLTTRVGSYSISEYSCPKEQEALQEAYFDTTLGRARDSVVYILEDGLNKTRFFKTTVSDPFETLTLHFEQPPATGPTCVVLKALLVDRRWRSLHADDFIRFWNEFWRNDSSGLSTLLTRVLHLPPCRSSVNVVDVTSAYVASDIASIAAANFVYKFFMMMQFDESPESDHLGGIWTDKDIEQVAINESEGLKQIEY